VQRDGLLTQNVDEHDTLHNMHQVILEMCSWFVFHRFKKGSWQ
jgi:hypothetical protein